MIVPGTLDWRLAGVGFEPREILLPKIIGKHFATFRDQSKSRKMNVPFSTGCAQLDMLRGFGLDLLKNGMAG